MTVPTASLTFGLKRPDAAFLPALPVDFPDVFLLAPPLDAADLPDEDFFAPDFLPPDPEADAPFAEPLLPLLEPDDFLLDFLAGMDLPS
jgi:hypothetical protein